MTVALVDEGDHVVYEPAPRTFAAVRPACPRCPWRGRPLTAGAYAWRMRIAMALHAHTCTNPDQEKPS